MRIALVAPLVAAIDDRRGQLGGAQSIVADLARGLVLRGHRVTVVAPRGSHIAGAEIVHLGIEAEARAAVRPRGPAASTSLAPAFTAVAAWLAGHSGELDVVHGHAFDVPALERIRGDRVVHTLHLPPLGPEIVRAAAAAGAWATLATVSASCRADWRAAGVEVPEILPNGIDVAAVPEGDGAGGFFAFAGRMSPEKGPDAACRVARAAGSPLRLAGPLYDREYFAREVEPLLDGSIEYVGALGRRALWHLLGSARATLLPVRWNEPFGLVALESLAAGTPVVAYARGALPEVVVDGRSGRLVAPDDEAAFSAAARGAGALARAACRADASRHDLAAMLDAHERLYRRLSA